MYIPPPPKQRPAGLGHATVLPDIDFETYSEAGFIWDEASQTWKGPEGASGNKKGLPVVGAAVYAKHPSTEVLSCFYDLKAGAGAQFWRPGMPLPADLFAHVAAGGLVEAHNSGFEHWIWNYVCTKLYGWPAIPQRQLRCSAAKSRAHALPGALAKVGEVLEIEHQKDPEGDRLLKLFSMPRKPTKTDPRRRIRPLWTQEDVNAEWALLTAAGMKPAKATEVVTKQFQDTQALARYNKRDIVAESEVSALVPDLSPQELAVWITDQEINHRGMAVDVQTIQAACEIISEVELQYGAEMARITGGIRPSEVAQLTGWLHGQGVHLDSLDEESVEQALTWDLPEDARRVLEIRALAGSASVKKVRAMRNVTTAAGRVHDLYTYHGARTGRPVGQGAQPTNLPRSGPDVWECASCHHHHFVARGSQCPWCGAAFDRESKRGEWSPEAMEGAIEVVRGASLQALEWFFSDALHAIAGTLRGLFVAAPGHDFISSDFSAIEGVVIAALAGERWRLEVFHGHGKIYEMSAAKILGIDFQEMLDYKARTGKHHPGRQAVGKVAELACLGADTPVLTRRGWVPIVEVLADDQVHDGVEWVSHEGVVDKGRRLVTMVSGVVATRDHRVHLGGTKWLEMGDLEGSTHFLNRALRSAGSLLKGCFGRKRAAFLASGAAVAVGGGGLSPSTTFSMAHRRSAMLVHRRHQQSPGGSTTTPCRKTTTGYACSTAFTRRLAAARTLNIRSGLDTAAEEFGFARSGLRTTGSGSPTCGPYRTGTTRKRPAIASTTTAGTSQGTCGSQLTRSSRATSDRRSGSSTGGSAGQRLSSTGCSARSTHMRTPSLERFTRENRRSRSSPSKPTAADGTARVFDLLNAGPRHRFVIATSGGPLVVHNCGFGGWINSWKQFGGPGTDEEIKANILAWRDESPTLVHLWGGQKLNWKPCLFGLEGMAIKAMQEPGVWQPVIRLDGTDSGLAFVKHGDVLYCRLPSGRFVTYHRPRLSPADQEWRGMSLSFEGWNTNPKSGPPGWIRINTYGSRIAENVTQACARDIQMHAIENAKAAGYPTIMHTYDEIVAEVPEGFGSVEELERLMCQLPAWAQGWPIKAAGGWRAKRYRKG